jgi:PAS domain S-box-containing protein
MRRVARRSRWIARFGAQALVYSAMFIGVVTSLLAWQATDRLHTFAMVQRELAAAAVEGAVSQIGVRVNELRRSVRLVAFEEAPLLRRLAAAPDDPAEFAALQARIQSFFPEVFAFTLVDGFGDLLLEHGQDLVGDVCRLDIGDFVLHEHRQSLKLHPHPLGSHFDVMVPVPGSDEELVFFVSFSPDSLARVLADAQPPGHHLYLVTESAGGDMVVDVAPGYWRTIHEEPRLIGAARWREALYQAPVPGTAWLLADLPEPGLFEAKRAAVWTETAMLMAAVLLAAGLMMAWSWSTERRRLAAERLLRDSHATLSAVVEGVADGVYLKDREARYRLVNRAYARAVGRTPAALLGRTDAEVLDPETAARNREAEAQVLRTGRLQTREEAAGAQRTVLVTRAPVRTDTGEISGVVGLRQDITELKRAEDVLRRHQLELAHVDRLSIIGELATGLAHELNQPLGAVVNYARASLNLVRSGAPDLGRLEEALEETVAQARRSSEIVRKAREFVRKGQPQLVCTDPAELVRQTLAFAEAELRARRVAVELALETGPDLRVRCDRIQMEQVLLNLIFNAVEAMEDAGSRPRRLRIGLARAGRTARITVADSGPGIADTACARVFEPFYTTRPEGTGMGLAICRTIVEAHGGHIDVQCRGELGGAAFEISLPLEEPCDGDVTRGFTSLSGR